MYTGTAATDSSAGPRRLFARFRDLIRERGAEAALSPETRIAASGVHEVFYIPFEHVEAGARLAIVGITPGPNQVALAYGEAREMMARGLP